MSVSIANLGFPRIGPKRELKAALERFWSGATDADTLQAEAASLRAAAWRRQASLGIATPPSNDFSLYDHVLDTSVMVGAVPQRYRGLNATPLATYFAMARGSQQAAGGGDCGHAGHAGDGHRDSGVPAQEMTKWFDTNYHYMVPEFTGGQGFELATQKPVDEFNEAKALGVTTRPVIVGPLTFLKLGKSHAEGFDPLSLLPGLLPVYGELLRRLQAAGADWVQVDEPCLALDLSDAERTAYRSAYEALAQAAPGLKLMLTPYFAALGDNLDTALSLPVAGLHLDLVRAPEQLDAVLARAPADLALSLGVIDGRNVWRTDLSPLLHRLAPVVEKRGAERVVLAPSCSLLHTPIDLGAETALRPEVKDWLAFAVQKLEELAVLGRALNEGRDAVREALEASDAAASRRRSSPLIHDPAVQARLAAVAPEMARRHSPFAERREVQRPLLGLPAYPTTTIGSFPQTAEVRQARAAHAKGSLDDAGYNQFLREETARAVRWQEEVGLDVLVHGEFERNDMVQYFAEQLERLLRFTKQRLGAVLRQRGACVHRFIFGDVTPPSTQ